MQTKLYCDYLASLSFWAANNLVVDDKGRLKLLEQDNVVYRLRTVLELINKVYIISLLSYFMAFYF